jgi:hypothetical protein
MSETAQKPKIRHTSPGVRALGQKKERAGVPAKSESGESSRQVPEREREGQKQRSDRPIKSNPVCGTTRMSWQRMETGEYFQCPEFSYLLGIVLHLIEMFPCCLVSVTFPGNQVLLFLPLVPGAFDICDLILQLPIHIGRKWRRLVVSRGKVRSQHRNVKDGVRALGALRQH